MDKKRNIAIVAGGYSSEYVISLKSAEGIRSFLDKGRYNAWLVLITEESWRVLLDGERVVPVNKDDFSFEVNGRKQTIDYAYIAIHGTPGEDGKLQGYFDMIGMPYSSCGVLASALTFNKYTCNKYLCNFGIRTAPSVHLFREDPVDVDAIVGQLGLPLFVKPVDGGSSFGVSKVRSKDELLAAVQKAFHEGMEAMCERYIRGTEVTCGCYKSPSGLIALPVTEVVTSNDFFDFDAKYNGQVDEITPARISDELTELIRDTTRRIYRYLGAKGIIRVDYIIPDDHVPVLLEVNTVPGMTGTSFIPQQVKASGREMASVLSEIIESEF